MNNVIDVSVYCTTKQGKQRNDQKTPNRAFFLFCSLIRTKGFQMMFYSLKSLVAYHVRYPAGIVHGASLVDTQRSKDP